MQVHARLPDLSTGIINASASERTVTLPFSFELTPQDREDLRWYIEDAPKYRDQSDAYSRVKLQLAKIGKNLFSAVFEKNADAATIWQQLLPYLHDARIEICDKEGRLATPWELLCEPATARLCVLCFTRFSRGLARRN